MLENSIELPRTINVPAWPELLSSRRGGKSKVDRLSPHDIETPAPHVSPSPLSRDAPLISIAVGKEGGSGVEWWREIQSSFVRMTNKIFSREDKLLRSNRLDFDQSCVFSI